MISKVFKCSRAFPLGKVDYYNIFTCLSGMKVLILVKFCVDFQTENKEHRENQRKI